MFRPLIRHTYPGRWGVRRGSGKTASRFINGNCSNINTQSLNNKQGIYYSLFDRAQIKIDVMNNKSKKHYPELDGLRGIAIFLVVAYHARSIVQPDSFPAMAFHSVLEAGWIGVDLFFVLSGFLITGVLFNSVDQKDYLARFYVRRIFRIFPVYYLALVAFPLGFYLLEMPQYAGPVGISYWVFLQNWLPFFGAMPDERFAHFWSLGIEEQFYLLWPILFLVLHRHKWALHAFAGLILASVVFRIFFVHYNTHSAGYFSTLSHIDGLIVGSALAYIFRQKHDPEKLRGLCTMVLTASPVSLVAVLIIANGFQMQNGIVLVYGLISVSVFFGSIVALSMLVPEHSKSRVMLRAAWPRFVGRISYGIYVYHWPLTLILMHYWPANGAGYWLNFLMFFTVVWCASIYVAWLSHLFIEQPIMTLRERVAPARAALAPCAPAVRSGG